MKRLLALLAAAGAVLAAAWRIVMRPTLGHGPEDHSLHRIQCAVERIEESVQRIERKIMNLQDQLTDVGTKLDKVTTDFAAVIDSAVARILAEIGKQGSVTPEIQAAADHLSSVADSLTALDATSLDRIANAGAPPVVPPVPDPIPPVPPPVDTGGTPPDTGFPPSARRR